MKHEPLFFLPQASFGAQMVNTVEATVTQSQPNPVPSLDIHLHAIERLVDSRGDGLDLCSQLLLNLVEVEAVVIRDQVDRKTKVPEATRASDAVKVRLRVLGEVEVDDDIDRLDVDTASDEVRRDQVAACAIAEVVEDAVAVRLLHLRVDVEARVPDLGDLLGEKFDTVERVAKDD